MGLHRRGNSPLVQDEKNVGAYYGPYTPTHHVGVTATYAIRGKKSARLQQGWEINSSINLQSGSPVNFADGVNDFAGIGGSRSLLGGVGEQWSLVGDPRNFHIGKTASTPCYAFARSRFASDPNCKPLVLGADNGSGQACIDAADGEAVNAAMNAQVPGSSSGLASLQRLGCYVSPNGRSLILPPAQGTFGTMGKDALFAAAFYEWDFSVSSDGDFATA